MNGEGDRVVRDAAAPPQAIDADTLEAVRCIREGLEQAKRGEGMPADEFFRAFRAKYGLDGRVGEDPGETLRGRDRPIDCQVRL